MEPPSPSDPNNTPSTPIRRVVIPVSCATHGGPTGFTNLMIRKLDGTIELDPHLDGSCVLILDEAAAITLRDALVLQP